MRVAVTGATGHLGAATVRDLLAHGFEVRALHHPQSDLKALAGLAAGPVAADILEPEQLRCAFDGVDAVVHLAGLISIDGDRDGLVARTNVEGARNVAEACLAAGVRRLVHISSIHAFKPSPRLSRLDETAPRADATCHAYDRSKAAGEDAVRAVAAKGLDLTILNPTALIGPYDFNLSLTGRMLCQVFTGGVPLVIQGGFDWIDTRDVAGAIRTALQTDANGQYLLCGHWVTVSKLTRLCGEASGVRRRRPAVPWCVARMGVPLELLKSRLTGSPPGYTGESLTILRDSRDNCCCEKARHDLGFEARPLAQTISDAHLWYEAEGFI